MQIAIFPSLIAPVSEESCFGGAEIQALSLAEALAARGHRVALVGMRGSRGRGLEIIEAPHTPIFAPGDVVSHDSGPFPGIFARIVGAGFDIIHAHFNDPGGLLALDELRACTVATLHLSAVFPSTTEVVRSTRHIQYVSPSRFAACSYGRAMHVVPNGVDGQAIEVGGAPRSGVAWAGRRVPEKGLHHAVEIARRAGMRLEIAGPGDPVSEGSGVVDHGRLSRAEVARLFGRAAITLITSSIAEAHPLVAIESLFAGTPVVGFDVGGLSEIIDASTGVLVPPGDVEAAVAAIDRARLLSSEACRARAERCFEHAGMVDAYERLYAT